MPKYAMEIGRVLVRSDKPITAEDRKRVLQQLRKRGDNAFLSVDDLEIVIHSDVR